MESNEGAFLVLFIVATLQAFAGYGDITPVGYPSWAERDVHIWTNMVRVDPKEFFGAGNDWGAGCGIADFQEDEKTPKTPLYYDYDLNDAGRYHSLDMLQNDWFDHDSSDGTSFPDRMARFYTESGYIGENIAVGYPGGKNVVLYGWMCSPGHRANIMNGDYNELGVGVAEIYYTQDFAAGVVETKSPIAMGNHSPEDPVGTIDFLADFQGAVPDAVEVVLSGESHALELTFGTASNGVYMTTLPFAADVDCHEYYFRWRSGDRSGTFPETESYLVGPACSGSKTSVPHQEDAAEDSSGFEDTEDDLAGCLCSSNGRVPAGQMGIALMLCGLLWGRRRS